MYNDEHYDINKFNDTTKILDFLKDINTKTRKTILSALVVATDKKEYRNQMLKDIEKYNKEIALQQPSDTQSENWLSSDVLKSTFLKLTNNAYAIYKKPELTNNDLQHIQNFIIISLYYLIAPRRLKDYTEFKIKNINKKTDNYMIKNMFVFNNYKTAKTYGEQKIEIPSELKSIIRKWIKVNPTEYLLFDSNHKQLSSIKLNQRLNKIFDKKISVNNIRHSYLTNKFGSTIEQNKNIKNTMSLMGSSVGQLTTYVKDI